MTAHLRRAAVLAVTALMTLPLGAGAQEAGPRVSVDRTGTAAGETLLITGTGWDDGSTLIVELCGHGGLRGSVDCDVANQRTAGVVPGGTFSVTLVSAQPPRPCPCVIKATDQATQESATAPIAVAGLATVPLTAEDERAVRAMEITGISLTGNRSWTELFGSGGRRVLEFTLVNTGPIAIDSPDVNLAWGFGSNPDGFVPPPDTVRLEPGGTQTITVPLDRDAFTIGSQTAVVEVQGLGTPVQARATTTAYPWGLLVIGVLALQLILLAVRNRVRRHLASRRAALDAAPALASPVLELTAGAVAVDLPELERAARNGSSPEAEAEAHVDETTGSPMVFALPAKSPSSVADDAAAARDEVVELRRQAHVALRQADDLSRALVDAAVARVQALEEQAADSLRWAESSHTAALEILASAKARAEDLVTEATVTAANMLRDAATARDAARQALADVRTQRDELLGAASEAVDEVLMALDEHVQLLAAVDADPLAPVPTVIDLDEKAPPAPRLGNLEARLAHAVAAAFAPTDSDASRDTTTD